MRLPCRAGSQNGKGFGWLAVPSAAPLADLALDPGQHGRHAAQPQRAYQVLQPELAGELRRSGQDLIGVQSIEPGVKVSATYLLTTLLSAIIGGRVLRKWF